MHIHNIIHYQDVEQMSELCNKIRLFSSFKITQFVHVGAKHLELYKRKKYIFLVKQTWYFYTLAPVFSAKRLTMY